MISSIIQELFKIKIQPNMSEQERNDKESMICLTPKPRQSFFVYCIQSKENFKKKKGSGKVNKNRKESFLTALVRVIKKYPTTLIRKNAYELKVYKKTEDSN